MSCCHGIPYTYRYMIDGTYYHCDEDGEDETKQEKGMGIIRCYIHEMVVGVNPKKRGMYKCSQDNNLHKIIHIHIHIHIISNE